MKACENRVSVYIYVSLFSPTYYQPFFFLTKQTWLTNYQQHYVRLAAEVHKETDKMMQSTVETWHWWRKLKMETIGLLKVSDWQADINKVLSSFVLATIMHRLCTVTTDTAFVPQGKSDKNRLCNIINGWLDKLLRTGFCLMGCFTITCNYTRSTAAEKRRSAWMYLFLCISLGVGVHIFKWQLGPLYSKPCAWF